MTFPFGQTITVSRPGGTDEFGDPTPGTKHEIHGCAMWQNMSTEDMQQRDTTTTTRTVLAPAGADILSTDLVWIPGQDTSKPARWQVDGDPWVIQSPLSGWRPGVQVQLKEVRG